MQQLNAGCTLSAPVSIPSPSKKIRNQLTVSTALLVTGEVNHYVKAMRAAIVFSAQWIGFTDDFLTFVKFSKVVSSVRGILQIKRFVIYTEQAICTDNAIIRIKATWLSFKNGKKVMSSVAWFANLFQDFGVLKPEQVYWTTYVSSVQLPFQAVSLVLALTRLGKIGLIWLEKEKCDNLMPELLVKVRKEAAIQFVTTLARSLSFTSVFFATVKPLPLLTSSVFTLSETALKTTKYFLKKREARHAKVT